MSDASSYRQILRSSSVIGGASVVNIGIGLLRMKAVALLLGPSGVGLIGLFTNLVALVSTVAGLGIGNVGTRQIAEAAGRSDPQRIATARRALFWGTLMLAGGGALVIWSLRGVFAAYVLNDATLAPQIGWLSLAVALTVAAASQNALLNGLRRIGDIARVQIASAVLSTVLGLLALWCWGAPGIVAFVVAAPLATFVLGHVFVARLPKVQAPASDVRELSNQWRVLVRLGTAFMVAGLAAVAAQLVVRTLVQRDLGADALGHFQAAWAISMTYIGFVLRAMGTDFYPRLTAIIQDRDAVNRLVNQQTEVALLLATPVLLAMLALAPWVIRLLYTAEFAEAALVLRWQVLGDFLKIASWPLGFILLASGAGRTYMLTEWTAMGVFVLLTWIGLPLLGLAASGMAFVGLYVVYLPLVYWLAVRRTAFTYSPRIVKVMISCLACAIVLMTISTHSEIATRVIGLCIASIFAAFNFRQLLAVVSNGSEAGKLRIARRAMDRLLTRKE
ncbi:O-antigen translocase [Luteimonas sp. FCS-9]|uniref:O-antigen translocase n=1 Tax=Luteimonas sp. FCS-9 TaxID=1547516 RepID=UPI000699336E|nr:O-antigen translocase [Luteimonas sp. FCS-9]